MQLFAQVKRQFFRPLRFDDASILLEGKAMPVLQILVGKVTDKLRPMNLKNLVSFFDMGLQRKMLV